MILKIGTLTVNNSSAARITKQRDQILKMTLKKILTRLLGNIVIFRLELLLKRWVHGNYIIGLTYHDTPNADLAAFETQLAFFEKYFEDCKPEDLHQFIHNGIFKGRKPKLLVGLDDGLFSNFENAAPLLEKYGFTGWFFLPAMILDKDFSLQDQRTFAAKGTIPHNSPGKKVFLDNGDVKEMQRNKKHFIGCHSYSHLRLSDDLSSEELHSEVNHACELFFEKNDHHYKSFAWVGGEEYSYGTKAFDLLKQQNLDFIFATNCSPIVKKSHKHNLNRYQASAKYNLTETRFAISSIYTLLYFFKRRRLRKKVGLL